LKNKKAMKGISNIQLSTETPVIVGFSGGSDSVALLHILHNSGYRCIAAHCNFHLRGEESMRDEIFARAFAETLQIPFEKIDFDTLRHALEHKISVEMAARELRYAWFETLRIKHQAEAIAVAHHRDDKVETVLLNLIRGTGIRGLTGMKEQAGHIVRPLLNAGKKEILEYIRENRLEYVTDSSNLSPEYTRNKIRLEVMPLLQAINPSAVEAIERTALHLSQVDKVYEDAVGKAKSSVISDGGNGEKRIDILKVQAFPSPEALLHEILSGYGFNPSVIRDIGDVLTGQSGKQFFSITHKLVKDRDFLILKPVNDAGDTGNGFTIPEDAGTVTYPVSLKMETVRYTSGFRFDPDKSVACFDKDKLRFPLYLRKWRAGDMFVPFGTKGKQKIAKYFKDHLYSQFQKEASWLLCSGDDIIWIVGERTDNRYRVEETTQTVYRINKSF
jgi:tRNA(Ile)-lysidine synthase